MDTQDVVVMVSTVKPLIPPTYLEGALLPIPAIYMESQKPVQRL